MPPSGHNRGCHAYPGIAKNSSGMITRELEGRAEMTETTLSGWGMRLIDTDPAEHALGMWKSPADGNDTTAGLGKQHMLPIFKYSQEYQRRVE